jgi:hypothetical protein
MITVLVAVAFLSGGALGFAVPRASAAEPCPHEYGRDADHHKQHQHPDSGAAGCLSCCCLGVCVTVQNIPMALNAEPAAAVSAVSYWGTSVLLDGRSIAPDPGPPKPIA